MRSSQAPSSVLAAVDIGTNSTRVLIARPRPGGIESLSRLVVVTRTGEGLAATGSLAGPAIDRVLGVLVEFRREADRAGALVVRAVGTHALRRARGRARLLEGARSILGVPLEVISGEEEARLTFLGAAGSFPSGTNILVVDIGGGSTELVFGESAAPRSLMSIEVGCLTLQEQFIHSDPPGEEELRACREFSRRALAPAVEEMGAGRPQTAIAVAGTPTSLVAVMKKLDPYDSREVHGSILTYEAIEEMLERLSSVPIARRKELPGLQPGRADVILTGACILLEAMKAAEVSEIVVSESDLLDGLLLSYEATGQVSSRSSSK